MRRKESLFLVVSSRRDHVEAKTQKISGGFSMNGLEANPGGQEKHVIGSSPCGGSIGSSAIGESCAHASVRARSSAPRSVKRKLLLKLRIFHSKNAATCQIHETYCEIFDVWVLNAVKAAAGGRANHCDRVLRK